MVTAIDTEPHAGFRFMPPPKYVHVCYVFALCATHLVAPHVRPPSCANAHHAMRCDATMQVDGDSKYKVTGRCSETMHREEWKVDMYHGRTAQIRVVDASSAGSGGSGGSSVVALVVAALL